ncbi:MAG: methyl-accepting chemotaxis protein [Azospirillaceae bacterium]|nr:methyl-accepting chemotaxis protein [Azospirillaceae bacterium]
MKLKTRIALGFATVILMSAAASTLGVLNLDRISRANRNAVAIGELADRLKDARLHEAGASGGDAGDAAAIGQELTALSQTLDRLAITGADLTPVRQSFADYNGAVDQGIAAAAAVAQARARLATALAEIDTYAGTTASREDGNAQVARDRAQDLGRQMAALNDTLVKLRSIQDGVATLRAALRPAASGDDLAGAATQAASLAETISALDGQISPNGWDDLNDAATRLSAAVAAARAADADSEARQAALGDAASALGDLAAAAGDLTTQKSSYGDAMRQLSDDAQKNFRNGMQSAAIAEHLLVLSRDVRLLQDQSDPDRIMSEAARLAGAMTSGVKDMMALSDNRMGDGITALAKTIPAVYGDIAGAIRVGTVARQQMNRAALALSTATASLVADERQTAAATATRSRRVLIGFGIGAVILSTLLSTGIGLGASRGIARLTEGMRRIADGELDFAVPHFGRRTELAAMAAALAIFRDQARQKSALESAAAATREQSERERRHAVEEMVSMFEGTVRSVVREVAAAAVQLRENAARLRQSAEQATALSAEAAGGTRDSEGAAQLVAHAAESLTRAIGEITARVEESGQTANVAVASARSAQDRLADLSQVNEQVNDIINLIQQVAAQTHLLALNATIEAVRAGDAGRGFVVVASEVKALAGQSREATDNISGRVAAIAATTGAAMKAMVEVGDSIARMGGLFTAVAGAVSEQDSATRDIARAAGAAVSSAGQISGAIAAVAEAAGATGRAAGDLNDAAHALSGLSAQLEGAVDQFVATARAA